MTSGPYVPSGRLRISPFLLYCVSQYQPAGRVVGEEFVEAPVARQFADLPPFAGLPGGIAGLLHELGHRIFVGRLRARPAVRHDWLVSPPVRKA